MAEIEKIVFDFQEIVTQLLKKEGIHEGIWALYVEFGITAANMGFDVGDKPGVELQTPPTNVLPTAIIPIKKIGIAKANIISSISVDAAVVNPKPNTTKAKTKK